MNNNEIKEILDDFLSRLGTLKYVKDNVSLDLRISKEEGLILLDNISSLREENKDLKNIISNDFVTQCINKLSTNDILANQEKEIERLIKENEILKENAIHNDKVVDKAKWNEMIYKSRIDKTNWWLKEMLKQAKSDETKAIINGTLDLLLNGGDKE